MNAPSYYVTVINDFGLTVGPQQVTIAFSPLIIFNLLSLTRRQRFISLDGSNLQIKILDTIQPNSNEIFFIPSKIKEGYFSEVNFPEIALNNFTKVQLDNSSIQFVYSQSGRFPEYNIQLFDGELFSNISKVNVTCPNCNYPELGNNQLAVAQGGNVVLSAHELNASDPLNPGDLIFKISNIQNGAFSFTINPTNPITQFTQNNITTSKVQFTHDDSTLAPFYRVTVVNDLGLQDGPVSLMSITFSPIITVNQLTITKEQQYSILGSANLQVDIVDTINPQANEIFWIPSNLQEGYFSNLNTPSIPLTNFTQEELNGANIQFVYSLSGEIPSYEIRVYDGQFYSKISKATVSCTNCKMPAASVSDTIRNAIIGAVVSGVAGILFFVIKVYLQRRANKYLEESLATTDEKASQERNEVRKNIIKPIAEKLFQKIKVTGFLGNTDKAEMDKYSNAVEVLVGEVRNQGVDLDNFKDKHPLERARIINAIANQTRAVLVPDVGCCTCTSCGRILKGLFIAEASPEDIEKHANQIALAVKNVLINKSLTTPKTESNIVINVDKNKPTNIELTEIDNAAQIVKQPTEKDVQAAEMEKMKKEFEAMKQAMAAMQQKSNTEVKQTLPLPPAPLARPKTPTKESTAASLKPLLPADNRPRTPTDQQASRKPIGNKGAIRLSQGAPVAATNLLDPVVVKQERNSSMPSEQKEGEVQPSQPLSTLVQTPAVKSPVHSANKPKPPTLPPPSAASHKPKISVESEVPDNNQKGMR